MDTLMGVIAVLAGLVTCFYGYPLFRLALILAGLIGGYALGQSLVQTGHPWLSLAVGVVAALALAVLAYPLWSIGVTVSGAVLGFIILGAMGVAVGASQLVVILLGIIGGLCLGLFFYSARDLFVMITTAFNGAFEVVFGLGWLVPALAFRRGPGGWLAVTAIVVLGAVGFAVQYGMFKDHKLYTEHLPKKK
ncbi:MAG: DUF4203 domain-containing protein [Deltaproteobacteria bacterium]|nr:DUF4203 domain-containing protein [Deltaproteobacteria bacterium]